MGRCGSEEQAFRLSILERALPLQSKGFAGTLIELVALYIGGN